MKVSEESSADMSVATSHRKEPTEMNVISKAKDVFKHSRLMIKNDCRFPKKERFMLSKDIYEYSRDLVNWHHLVRDMDELYNKLFKEETQNVSTSIEPADRGKSEVR